MSIYFTKLLFSHVITLFIISVKLKIFKLITSYTLVYKTLILPLVHNFTVELFKKFKVN